MTDKRRSFFSIWADPVKAIEYGTLAYRRGLSSTEMEELRRQYPPRPFFKAALYDSLPAIDATLKKAWEEFKLEEPSMTARKLSQFKVLIYSRKSGGMVRSILVDAAGEKEAIAAAKEQVKGEYKWKDHRVKAVGGQ